MGATLDYSDVPQTSSEALMLMMEEMIVTGRGLVLLRDMSDREVREIEKAVWERLDGTPAEKLAALLRFRCLIAVFAGARLRQLFLSRGLALMEPAVEVAAEMRLNVQWGFSPVKFLRSLQERLSDIDQRVATLRIERPAELQVGIA